jgi:predicted transcriptional regulator
MTMTRKPTRKLICSKCGAKARAGCDCGAIYQSAGIVAANALRAHPEKSNRMIAKETGVDESTVREARKKDAGNPAVRIGRDGKLRRLPYHLVSRQLKDRNPMMSSDELKAVPAAVELIQRLTPTMNALKKEVQYHEATISPREVSHLVRQLLTQINSQTGWSPWLANIYEDCALEWTIDETQLNDKAIDAVRHVADAWNDLAERMLAAQKETKTVSQPTHYTEEARPGNGAAPIG